MKKASFTASFRAPAARSHRLALAATLWLSGMMTAAAAEPALSIDEIGSFHVGGRTAELSGLPEREVRFTPTSPVTRLNPNGSFEVEQMYVQFVKLTPAARRGRWPLLMMHGGGMTGVTWETRPDGKPGWQMRFLQSGQDVYVADAVERGRSSWARYPEIFKSEPVFRSKREAWELFRLGPPGSYAEDPAKRATWPGSRFPTAYFDQFMKQGVPRWVTNDPPTQAAYRALVEKICPCVLMAHSQGSTFAYRLAQEMPERIKAVIGIEPSGALVPGETQLGTLKDIPMLFVWGDRIQETPRWVTIQKPLRTMITALKAQGNDIEELDLPARGIRGNTHFIMMDNNADEVAALVQQWLEKKGLSR